MKLFSTMRARKQPWGRRTLGAFVIVWLSFALQPCVMALEADHDGDCPHCPPAMAERHDGHAMHDMDAMHDMAQMQMPCAGSTDCGDLDDFNYDGRSAGIKLDKPVDHLLTLVPLCLDADPPPVAPRLRHAPALDHRSGAPPPRHLLNCVFLD